jgi:hypothetical protein
LQFSAVEMELRKVEIQRITAVDNAVDNIASNPAFARTSEPVQTEPKRRAARAWLPQPVEESRLKARALGAVATGNKHSIKMLPAPAIGLIPKQGCFDVT